MDSHTREGAVPVVQLVGPNEELALTTGQSAVLGRARECDVVVAHTSVSRQHARVEVHPNGQVLLVDLDSTNGTFVDGQAVPPAATVPLYPGASIRLGQQPDLQVQVHAIATPVRQANEDEIHQTRPAVPTIPDTAPIYAATGQEANRLSVSHQPAGDLLTIGRAPDNSLRVADPELSRHHARAWRAADGSFEVEDLNSFNGSYLNGVPLQRAIVRPGDVLTMGRSTFRVRGGQLVHSIDTGVELRAQQLTVQVDGGRTILDNVSFVLPAGQLMAVIGPSGAGKTTLLRALTGARPADSGTVLCGGRDLYQQYTDLANRIGVVPQDDIVHRALTLGQALGFAADLRFPADLEPALRAERVHQVAEQLQLADRLDTRVAKLSGGQRKRVSVAMELLTQPTLLLLDEPTSGLDPNLDRAVMELLREQADQGRTVLVITHSLASLHLCDRVLLLAPGGLVAYDGSPDGLLPHFGATDPADVFATVAADPVGAHRRALTSLPPQVNAPPVAVELADIRRRPHPIRQFTTVLRRQARLALADRSYAIAAVLLPVVLGLMVLAVPGHNGLRSVPARFTGESTKILVLMMVGAAFMGAAATIRELVAERAIYLRERAVGLSTVAYLSGKVTFIVGLCLVQSLLLAGLVLATKARPTSGAAFAGTPGAVVELILAMWLTAVAAAMLGLLLSAVVSTAEQVMPILVIAVMAQLVLCGGLIEVTGRPVLEQLSWLAPARWGFAAAASTTSAMVLDSTLPSDLLWRHQASWWRVSMASLVLLSATSATLALLALRRTKADV